MSPGRRQSHTWISKSEEDDHVQETEAFSGFAVPDVEAASSFYETPWGYR